MHLRRRCGSINIFISITDADFRTAVFPNPTLILTVWSLAACLSLLCGLCPSYGWRRWGVSREGVVVKDEGSWRSTSLRERDCLAREEPRRREGCRSTQALSLRATFLLWGGKWDNIGRGGVRVDGRKRGKEKKTNATGTTKGNQRVKVRENGVPQRRGRNDMRIVSDVRCS